MAGAKNAVDVCLGVRAKENALTLIADEVSRSVAASLEKAIEGSGSGNYSVVAGGIWDRGRWISAPDRCWRLGKGRRGDLVHDAATWRIGRTDGYCESGGAEADPLRTHDRGDAGDYATRHARGLPDGGPLERQAARANVEGGIANGKTGAGTAFSARILTADWIG